MHTDLVLRRLTALLLLLQPPALITIAKSKTLLPIFILLASNSISDRRPPSITCRLQVGHTCGFIFSLSCSAFLFFYFYHVKQRRQEILTCGRPGVVILRSFGQISWTSIVVLGARVQCLSMAGGKLVFTNLEFSLPHKTRREG